MSVLDYGILLKNDQKAISCINENLNGTLPNGPLSKLLKLLDTQV